MDIFLDGLLIISILSVHPQMVFKEKNKYKSSEFLFSFSSLSLVVSFAVYASLLLVDFSSVHITAGFRNNFQDQKRLPVYILRVKIAAAFEEGY
jgi:hypothetical protein